MESTEELRKKWKQKETWSTGTFDSLERFVTTKSEETITAFVQSGSLVDLFQDSTEPKPKPSLTHQEYMRKFAQAYLTEKD